MSGKYPVTATHYLSALRLLAKNGPMALAELAEADNRVKSNLRRDIPKLVTAGLVQSDDGTLSLTDTGKQWVHGQDVAEGLARPPASPSASPARWPLDAIRPNPLNRKVTEEGIDDLAQSIASAGDIIQPLNLTPPDAHGVRTILAGERRWRAACLLRADGIEVEALEEGVPFVERAATEAEAILITIIENSQRLDLTPWDDAQQLRKLADATGWNATELARRIGRADTQGRSGVRDVQTKLKVAREATPEAIAEYEATGSWDRLRDSVSKPKSDAAPTPVERAEALLDQKPEPALPLTPAGAGQEPVTLSDAAHLAWRELLHKISTNPAERTDPAATIVGQYWLCPLATELTKARYVAFTPFAGSPPRARVTEQGIEAARRLRALWGTPDGEEMDWSAAVNILRPEGDFDGTNYLTPWLAKVPVAALYAAADTAPASQQIDVEQAIADQDRPTLPPSTRLALADIRLTASTCGGYWDLYHGSLRMASWIAKGVNLTPEDQASFAQRLADAFNAAQDAAARKGAA